MTFLNRIDSHSCQSAQLAERLCHTTTKKNKDPESLFDERFSFFQDFFSELDYLSSLSQSGLSFEENPLVEKKAPNIYKIRTPKRIFKIEVRDEGDSRYLLTDYILGKGHQKQAKVAILFNQTALSLVARVTCRFSTEMKHRFSMMCQNWNCQFVDDGAGLTKSLNREVKVQQSFNHNPFVVDIYDHGQYERSRGNSYDRCVVSTYFMYMELCDFSLASSLEDYSFSNKKGEDNAQMTRIMHDVLCALKDIHEKKMVYRDLSPGNIFLKKMPDESLVAKIGDFESCYDESMEMASFQTPLYMSPEMIFKMSKAVEKIERMIESRQKMILKYAKPESSNEEGEQNKQIIDRLVSRTIKSEEEIVKINALLVNYDCSKQDIWSFGCLLYEILMKKPLYARLAEVKDVNLLNFTATPSHSAFESVSIDALCLRIDQTDIEQVINEVPELDDNIDYKRLLRETLAIEPSKRLSAGQILQSL